MLRRGCCLQCRVCVGNQLRLYSYSIREIRLEKGGVFQMNFEYGIGIWFGNGSHDPIPDTVSRQFFRNLELSHVQTQISDAVRNGLSKSENDRAPCSGKMLHFSTGFLRTLSICIG